MFFAKLSGTPYEMGHQLGCATRLAIASTLDYLTKSFRHWDNAQFQRARERHMAYTEKRMPDLVEEIQGIADGSGFPFKWLYLANFYASLGAANAGCSNIIFTETPDGPLLGKTNDLPASEGKHAGMCLVRPKGGMAWLAFSLPGTVWFAQGINEAGLALGGSSCGAAIPPPAECFNPHLLGRYVLSRCETVDQAIALLKKNSASKWGANLALLDKTGAAAVVEKAGDFTGVRRPEGKRLWCTNHALTPELGPHGNAAGEVLKETHERFDAIDRLTSRAAPSLELMREVVAYNGRPGALCRYGDDDPLQYETEWTCILQPAKGMAEVCFSHADRDPWRRFSIARGWENATRDG